MQNLHRRRWWENFCISYSMSTMYVLYMNCTWISHEFSLYKKNTTRRREKSFMIEWANLIWWTPKKTASRESSSLRLHLHSDLIICVFGEWSRSTITLCFKYERKNYCSRFDSIETCRNGNELARYQPNR